MKFLRGIERFTTNYMDEKSLIGKYIINDGDFIKMKNKVKEYEQLLGIKNDNFEEKNELNIKKVLLNYLDYLDYYIISHFLSNVYEIAFNPKGPLQVTQDVDILVDFVTLLYNKRYPDDKEIDIVKYNELRIEFNNKFGRF